MDELGKVIDGLNMCAAGKCDSRCPYNDAPNRCRQMLMIDARDLLLGKTTEFYAEGDGYADGEMVYDEWYCGYCMYHFPDDDKPDVKFCPNCGRRFVDQVVVLE